MFSKAKIAIVIALALASASAARAGDSSGKYTVGDNPPGSPFQDQGIRHDKAFRSLASPDAESSDQGARRSSARGSYNVYGPRGRYVGTDPDPRVRDQLAHDPGQGLD